MDAVFERFHAAVDAADDTQLRALVVLRDGVPLARAAWTPWRLDDRALVYSCSKTFTATAIGLACAEGLLGLDDLVVDHFPDAAAGPLARTWTLRHLLTMTTGHTDDVVQAMMDAPRDAMPATFLGLEPTEAVGVHHAYNNGSSWLLGEIVRRRTGVDLLEYLTPRVLAPLGIDATWDGDPTLGQYGSTGVHVGVEGLAKLAELYRRDGVAPDGRRLLPEGWVREATRKHADTVNEKPDWCFGYGFQLWLGREGYRLDGLYGQYALVLPERRAVIAVASAQPRSQHLMELIFELLVPELESAPAGECAVTGASAPAPSDDGAAGPWASGRPVVDESLAGWPDASFSEAHPREASQFLLPELDAVRVARSGGGWRVELDEAGVGTWVAVTDAGGWQRAELKLGVEEPAGMRVPIGLAAGADVSGDVFVDIAFVETPHLLHLAVGRAGGRAAWNVSPVQGAWNTPARTFIAELKA